MQVQIKAPLNNTDRYNQTIKQILSRDNITPNVQDISLAQ